MTENGTAYDPLELYLRRLAECERTAAVWGRRDSLLGTTRLVVVALGLVAAWFSLQNQLFSPLWLGLPVLLLLGLIGVHERVARDRGRAERALSYYRRGIERVRFVRGEGPFPKLDSSATQEGQELRDEERYGLDSHLYAADLDLFGDASLFELICGARTQDGRDTLAGWLLAPASPDEVRSRQEGVAELRGRPELREQWSVLGGEIDAGLDSRTLEEWSEQPPRLRQPALRLGLGVLGVGNVVTLIGWLALGWLATPFLVSVLLSTVVTFVLRGQVAASIKGVDRANRQLDLLAGLLALLESETFTSSWLSERVDELNRSGVSPGVAVRRLERRVDMLESRRNPFFAPIGGLVLWTSHWACSLESWREAHGEGVGRWLEIVGEFEALASLAGWSWENPEDPFPELLESGSEPILEGRGLGHPLLPRSVCVVNDLDLGAQVHGLIVSGSNMSGKSTFLRTTGINVVLAQAGACVRAESLRLSPLQVGASIRIQDSLQEGSSRFYAEITRLRRVLELTEKEVPVYFLLDEILAGTNSHDRRIGAEAVVRALLERGSLGLVTTHDLALARIAEDSDLRVKNVHFEDTLEDGKIHFDYRLHEGVVTRSNALALMREVGLEV